MKGLLEEFDGIFGTIGVLWGLMGLKFHFIEGILWEFCLVGSFTHI